MIDINDILKTHVSAQIKATHPREYRGWSVRYDPPPIPARNCDWQATHPDYDASYEGEEDGWIDNGLKASGATFEELCAVIDELQDEWDEANGQFGVGA